MSISLKITVVVSFLAGLLLLAMGYAALLQRESETSVSVKNQAKVLSRVLKLAAESALKNYGQMGALVDLVANDTRAEVTFYDRRGYAVAPVPLEEAPVVNTWILRVMERKISEEDFVDQAYAIRVPLFKQKEVAGALELRIDIASSKISTWPRSALLVGGGLLLIFALTVGLFSRQSIGRPIDHLMNGMDHVIKGDLTVAIPLERNDEIGHIAYRFNEMTAQLRDAQEEIRSSAGARLQLEQRLRQSEKLATIGQLSAEIAHEVGTPLNVIGGRARTLKRKAEQPEEVIKNSQIIADQAERITKIIQQMLNLSRARTPDRTRIDILQIIGDALTFLEYQMEHAAIEVEQTLELPGSRLQGDADGLQQVLINLLLNAIQAMPDGGRLTIAAREVKRRKGGLDLAPPQEYVLVEIKDTGPGIAAAELEQIFEPFYSTKERGKGTGLGLTVTIGIVKEHDGWMEVENAEPQGSIFRVYLPLDDAQAQET